MAQQAGVDLAQVKGSGPHGRIIRRDVEGLKGQPGAARPAPTPTPAPAEIKSLEQMGIAPGSYDLVPLDGMLRTVAKRMSDSFRDVPHFPLTIDLEIDRLLEARTRINALLEKDGVKVSVNDIVIKAAANALKRVPADNASYTPEGFAMHHHAGRGLRRGAGPRPDHPDHPIRRNQGPGPDRHGDPRTWRSGLVRRS